MALDARKRQKKAEKRNAKQKARQKEQARRKTEDMGQRLERLASAPILHCCTTQDLWDKGMAQVLLSRELANSQVAFSLFLVDRYCLGVKDALCGFTERSNYFDNLYERFATDGNAVALQPAEARKLVESAVEYARGIGLSPHAKYAQASAIFGDIDAAASNRTFEFGSEGKPLFIAGPNDSPGRCASIVGLLQEHCGAGNFDYIVHVPAGSLSGLNLLNLAEAFDEEDDADSESVIEGSVITESYESS
jgi:hypothetical protein